MCFPDSLKTPSGDLVLLASLISHLSSKCQPQVILCSFVDAFEWNKVCKSFKNAQSFGKNMQTNYAQKSCKNISSPVFITEQSSFFCTVPLSFLRLAWQALLWENLIFLIIVVCFVNISLLRRKVLHKSGNSSFLKAKWKVDCLK